MLIVSNNSLKIYMVFLLGTLEREQKQNPGGKVLNTMCGNPLILPPQKYNALISKTFPGQKVYVFVLHPQ